MQCHGQQKIHGDLYLRGVGDHHLRWSPALGYHKGNLLSEAMAEQCASLWIFSSAEPSSQMSYDPLSPLHFAQPRQKKQQPVPWPRSHLGDPVC